MEVRTREGGPWKRGAIHFGAGGLVTLPSASAAHPPCLQMGLAGLCMLLLHNILLL